MINLSQADTLINNYGRFGTGMIIKSNSRLPVFAADSYAKYPVLPLMTGVLFPGMMFTIQIGRPENIEVIKLYQNNKKKFITSYSHAEVETPKDPPIHQVGVFTIVRDVSEGPGGSKKKQRERLL